MHFCWYRVFWTDREGEAPDKTSYYPSMDYGIDSNRTFELQDLIIFTDNLEVSQTLLTRQCNRFNIKFKMSCPINN